MRLVKRKVLIAFFIIMITGIGYASYHLFMQEQPFRASSILKPKPNLQFHPIDHDVTFIDADTTIFLESRKRDKHTVRVQVTSKTSVPTLIRQDVSLVFANGLLVKRLFGSKEHTDFLHQDIYIKGEGSTRYDIITFHHAEIMQEQNQMRSQQTMSRDQVYLLSSAFTPSQLFREAQTNTQKHWKRILDNAIQEQWNYQWNHLISHFGINSKEYTLIPLIQLEQYMEESLPRFNEKQTEWFIGFIWESLFQHYVREIHAEGQKSKSPKGSSMPIILFAHDHSHVLILFRSSDGEEIRIHHPISIDD